MALRPSEQAERAFGRAGQAAERARNFLATGNQLEFNGGMASALVEMAEGLKQLAVALRQTFALVEEVNKFVRLP